MRFFVACIVLGCAWVCHGALGVVSDTVPKLTLQPASTKKTAMHLFDAQLGCVPTLKLDDQYTIAALRESRNLQTVRQLGTDEGAADAIPFPLLPTSCTPHGHRLPSPSRP